MNVAEHEVFFCELACVSVEFSLRVRLMMSIVACYLEARLPFIVVANVLA